ncbi:MAG: Zn-dependent protease [Acidobacteria bacterium]|nr:Zn-dependent protease [Acidobacteriota bacterium]
MDLNLPALFISFLALLFSLTVHEAAHAWAADRLGDPTAKALGRLSLNPAVHVDPLGTLVFPLVAMVTGAPLLGWAKPVPIAPWRFEHPRRASMLVALAGPLSNLAMAFAAAVALRLLPADALGALAAGAPAAGAGGAILAPVARLAWGLLTINLLLAIFNLLPIPPLDGSSVLGGLLPERAAAGLDRLRPYGFLLLYALLLSGGFSLVVNPPYFLLLSWLT